MNNFLKYMIKPMIINLCVPFLGLVMYFLNNREHLLLMSILLYIGLTIGHVISYFLYKRN